MIPENHTHENMTVTIDYMDRGLISFRLSYIDISNLDIANNKLNINGKSFVLSRINSIEYHDFPGFPEAIKKAGEHIKKRRPEF